MKKLLFAAILLVLCSCSGKEKEPITTYQIFNSSNQIVTNIKYLDGTMYEVIVDHYKETTLVKQDTIDEIPTRGGQTAMIEVPPNTDLFKVSFKYLPSKSVLYDVSWNIRYYFYDYKIVQRGKNNIFGVNGGSFISEIKLK